MNRLFIALLLVVSSGAHAWQLQPDMSMLNFISIKKNSIGELHQFKQLQGAIDAAGVATLTIPLTSVATGVEIRDQRMRDLLFDVVQFPVATVRVAVDLKSVEALPVGGQAILPLKGDLSLHGKTAPVVTDALVTKLADGRLSVVSRQPVLLSAEAFDLGAGVTKLAEAASLPAISTAVPVTFALVFAPEPAATLQAPSSLQVQ